MKRRPCPNCCPQAAVPFYRVDAEEPHVYQCDNCRHTVTIKPRRPQLDSPKQAAEVERITNLLADRFEVKDGDPERFWARKGTRCLVATGRKWYDDSMLIYVGPRGALRVVDCGTRPGRSDRRGRDARIWLDVRGR